LELHSDTKSSYIDTLLSCCSYVLMRFAITGGHHLHEREGRLYTAQLISQVYNSVIPPWTDCCKSIRI